ncbi:MarR family transcriptional regulator [Clostridium neuense]|uniref:HTH-type transcriptional regulator SarZ n=1 Tax=Clostridium neuense TaxID=1728934 RepID=A0ABW8TFF6_9CLOT
MDKRIICELFGDIFSVMPVFNKIILNVGDKILKDKGITTAHIKVMYIVKECKKTNITELGKMLSSPKSNVTSWTNKLVGMNLVKRVYDENDRRIIYVRLTDEGEKFMQFYKEALMKSFEEKLWRFSDEDLILFKDTLDNMRKLIDKIK